MKYHEASDSAAEAPIRMLIVEDNDTVSEALQDFFEYEGYHVTVANDGEEALQMMQNNPAFDVVLLDVMLPKKNGFEVLKESQEMGFLSPVLMLTGRGEQESVLKGFGLGAADYVVKPFKPDELAARVKAILGRHSPTGEEPTDTYRFGSIEVNFGTQQVHQGEERLELSELEFDLLRYLIQHRGQVLTLKRLLRDVLSMDLETMAFSVDQDTVMRTIDQHIFSLRQKLELNPTKPVYIETVYGQGYRFNG